MNHDQSVSAASGDPLAVGLALFNRMKQVHVTDGNAAAMPLEQEFEREWINHVDPVVALYFQLVREESLKPLREKTFLDQGPQEFRTKEFRNFRSRAERLGIQSLPDHPATPFSDGEEADAAYARLRSAVRIHLHLRVTPDRPFDPNRASEIIPDSETIASIQTVIRDWDGRNWDAVREVLRLQNRQPAELEAMTLMGIRMAFAIGQRAMVDLIGGTAETTTQSIVKFDSAGADSAGEAGLILHRDDRAILDSLAKSPVTLMQVDLEQQLNISRRSLGERLEKLRSAGLTHRPNGDRGGEAITEAGRALIAH